MDHYGIHRVPLAPHAVAMLLAAIEAPFNPATHMPYERERRIYEAARCLREAQAADELASWEPTQRSPSAGELSDLYRRQGALQNVQRGIGDRL